MGELSTQPNLNGSPAQANERTDPLLAAWGKTRIDHAERAAVLDARGNVARTFRQIEERADTLTVQLKQLQLGEVVAIQIGNHPDWPSLLLSCLRRGLVALPLERTISAEQERAAFATCRVAGTVRLTDPAEVTLKLTRRDPSAPRRFARDDERPVLLKLTSGTTGEPRAVRFRSEQLLADCDNICDTMGLTSADLNFGVIPVSHSYGFSNLLTPLLARGIPLALSNDPMPRAVLEAIAATGATVFPGMPVFYQSFCQLGDRPRLPQLRLCISAGAPLNPAVKENFRAAFGRDIHSFYGSSECGGICYTREPQSNAGFVGQPMEGVTVEPLDPDTASIVRVRSRAVGDGYFPIADPAKLGDGFFVPDDLLEKTPAGYRIVGRSSDLINVAGKKVNPAEVEAVLLQCSAVREAVVFGRESERRNEEVAAGVVAAGTVSEAELLAHCRRRLSSWQTPRRIYFFDVMPVNERGKLSRRELARRYPAGC